MRIATIIRTGVLALALSGCAMGGTHGGTKTFDCSGSNIGWDECDKQAVDACGDKGYTVVKRNIDSQSGTVGASQMKRELIVSCK